jgi:3-(3-hydroxy-phenyl)propionate hydroxylase
LRHFPQARDYVTKMKFKPMPRYLEGVVAGLNGTAQNRKRPDPIGRMLIQPDVELTDGTRLKLDEALGDRFALVGLRMDPRSALDKNELDFWERLGARFVQINRSRIAKPDTVPADGLLVLDDVEGGFRDWEAAWKYRVLFVRPDRYLAAATLPENTNAISHMLQMTIGVGH